MYVQLNQHDLIIKTNPKSYEFCLLLYLLRAML